MSRLKAVVVVSFAAYLAGACNQGEFAGSGKKAEVKATKKEDASPRDTDRGDNGPNELGNPSNDDKSPGDNSDNNKPGGSGGDDNVNDLLDGLLNGDGETENGTAVSPDEVVYGGNKVFHLGDSNFPNSDCKDQVGAMTTAGARYYFEFTVTQPGTTVTVSVNRVCGVDYGDSNIFAVAHGGAYIQEQKMQKGATSASLTTGSLQPGKYAIAIESRADSQERLAENPANAGTVDRDDFLVGEVRIKGSLAITPGKAGAK